MNTILILNPENVNVESVSSYKTRFAARGVVFDENKNIALLPVTAHNYYKLPGGGIEEGENKIEYKKELLYNYISMKYIKVFISSLFFLAILFILTITQVAQADTALTLTSGNDATTTPSVATAITGFQIVGNSASTTPVKLHVTNGTLHLSTVSGVTMSGNDTDTINISGTVSNLNTALTTLTYSRVSIGSDNLEIALVNSNQIYFPDNGHVYQYVNSSLDWNNAKSAAEQLTAYGATGYLVTITSSAENTFVKNRLNGDAWIGASDSGTEGTWKWVTGPEAGTTFWQGLDSTRGGHTVSSNYASWGGGEPNDSGGSEDCGEEYVANGTWNDLPCSGSTIGGYVAEFGGGGSDPTVVSKNISIVTADVPAVTSLFPANGATSVLPSANLIIGFSKSVVAGYGTITIKKSSDNSTIETINASSSLVTGGGTNSITINPTANLDEGAGYYVIVSGLAFKDSSNNNFDGILATSTWAFTTSDVTAPVISSVAATLVSTTSASVVWTTNESASSIVVYSTGTSFASSTGETDMGSRVTNHTKPLSGLSGCTVYNFKVASSDAFGNYATSSSSSFITSGCTASATSSSATTTDVTVSSAATSTLTDSGRTLVVSTLPNFTATSSTVVIQVKAQDSTVVLDSIGIPSGLSSAAKIVFDVTALINQNTVLDSFDSPVTISYTYTDADIGSLDESTLSLYHYHSGSWIKLDNCVLDTAANKITCTTPSFSVFALFGTPTVTPSVSPVATVSYLSARSSGTKLGCKDPNASNYDYFSFSKPELCVYTKTLTVTSSSTIKVRDLKFLMTGDDVISLQKLLNSQGYLVTQNGPGSTGNETIFFGSLTKKALMRYQADHHVTPAVGYFGPLTRVNMKMEKISGLWW